MCSVDDRPYLELVPIKASVVVGKACPSVRALTRGIEVAATYTVAPVPTATFPAACVAGSFPPLDRYPNKKQEKQLYTLIHQHENFIKNGNLVSLRNIRGIELRYLREKRE